MIKYLIIILTLITFSCSVQRTSCKDEIIFTYKIIPGRGITPNYDFNLYKSGKLTFISRSNYKLIGRFQAKADKSFINELKHHITDTDFYNLESIYTARLTDLSTRILIANFKGEYKKVKDYYGAPQKLKKLEKFIENTIDSTNWIKSKLGPHQK
jgi:hypothetical protein